MFFCRDSLHGGVVADNQVCSRWDEVFDALTGETASADVARSHLAACPSCDRLFRLHAGLQQASLRDVAFPDPGLCPPVETLAAYAAGDASSVSLDAHLAACPSCRDSVAGAWDDRAETVPADVVARLAARARAVIRAAMPPVVRAPSISAPVPGVRFPAWGWMVPASLAAGLLGGVFAVRWLSPTPALVGPFVTPVAPVAAQVPDRTADVLRRQSVMEERAAAIEKRMEAGSEDLESLRGEAKALSAALEGIRKDLAVLEAGVREIPKPPDGVPAAAPAEMKTRLDRLQADLARVQADLAATRQEHEGTVRELAEARRVQAQVAEQVRQFLDRTSVAAVPTTTTPPSPVPVADFENLFAIARQGTKDEFPQALDALRIQGLDVLAHAVVYYSKEAPKERRALAGDELNRKGAKGVDHDLILAMAHDQLPVRREAAVHLAKYRTRGQDFGFNPSNSPEERQRGLLKAIRWWESEYRDDYPEKARFQQGVIIVHPVGGSGGVRPVTPAPSSGTPAPAAPPPVPPQYNPPR
jgi:hypothetical protein